MSKLVELASLSLSLQDLCNDIINIYSLLKKVKIHCHRYLKIHIKVRPCSFNLDELASPG